MEEIVFDRNTSRLTTRSYLAIQRCRYARCGQTPHVRTSNSFCFRGQDSKLITITILSYIANLDAAYVYALFQRASFLQVAVLRYAIWKHIAFQTSIRVKIPVST